MNPRSIYEYRIYKTRANTLQANAVVSQQQCIAAVTPRVSRTGYMAIFGSLNNGTIWAKERLSRWVPQDFSIIPAGANSCPSVTSHEDRQADILYITNTGNVEHKAYQSANSLESWYTWATSGYQATNLGGNFTSIATSIVSRENPEQPGGLVVVGRNNQSSYAIKYKIGDQLMPKDLLWEDLAGIFHSDPDVITTTWFTLVTGIGTSGELLFKVQPYIQDGSNGQLHLDTWSSWYHIEGPFKGNPLLTSRERMGDSQSSNEIDIWALSPNNSLVHMPLDVFKLVTGESPASKTRKINLGGQFKNTPRAVYHGKGMYYVVGKGNDDKFCVKTYDAADPADDESEYAYLPLAGPFASEPGIITLDKTGVQEQTGKTITFRPSAVWCVHN